MRVTRALAIALIAASLASNVCFLLRSEKEEQRPGIPSALVSEHREPGRSVPSERGTLPASCPRQLMQVTERLADVERKLDERLTFEERFDVAASTPANEEALRAATNAFLEKAPTNTQVDVECRGDICKLEIVSRERGEPFDWERFQTEILHDRTRGYMVGPREPSHDLVSKEALMVQRVYAQLERAGTVSGLDTLAAVVRRIDESGAVARCHTADATPGFATVKLTLDASDRAITYVAGGTLTSLPRGRCLLGELDTVLAMTAVPPNARDAVLYHTVDLP